MKIFNRQPEPLPSDEHLTFFTTAEADTFRELVRASFADVGRDVTVTADHVEDRTGTTFGLWNIGALCRREELGGWADLIDDHVQRVTTPTLSLADLAREEIDARVCLQLVDAASLSDPDEVSYARAPAPGLLEVVSVDLPDSVVTLSEAELRAHGGPDDLVERGRANLHSVLSGDLVAETVVGQSGGRFTAVTGVSFFTASLALLLPELMERLVGDRDEGRGALLAVPFRHELLFRVVDGPDARPALDDMFEVARRRFMTNAGPVSPDVYWVRNNRWVPVTSVEGTKPAVLYDGGLADVLR